MQLHNNVALHSCCCFKFVHSERRRVSQRSRRRARSVARRRRRSRRRCAPSPADRRSQTASCRRTAHARTQTTRRRSLSKQRRSIRDRASERTVLTTTNGFRSDASRTMSGATCIESCRSNANSICNKNVDRLVDRRQCRFESVH
jgi:hypothetical protein